MIAAMRKVTVLAAARDRDALVQRLFEASVVHVEGEPLAANSGELAAAKAELDAADQAIGILAAESDEPVRDTASRAIDVAVVVAEVRAMAAQRAEAQRAMLPLQAERTALLPFGNFEPLYVVALQRSGVNVGLYQYPIGSEPELPATATLHELGEVDGVVSAAIISRGRLDLSLRPLPLPQRSLGEVDRELATLEQKVSAAETALARLVELLPALRAARATLKDRVEWHTARATMGSLGPVVSLTGFVPADREAALRHALEGSAVAVLVREVGKDDVVPTLLEGPKWVRQVHTVFQGIGIVPGYAEADVSSLFLVFLLLFAAMLIGDAGYGALLVLIGAFAWHKTKSKPGGVPQAVRLLLTTGVATLVWGAITATWFALPNLPAVFDTLRIDWLAPIDPQTGLSDKTATTKHIMLLCFVLGAVHLTLAHLWAALRCGRSLQALAQLGWVGCTWLMFLLARTMVLGEAAPGYTSTLAIVAITAVVLFMTPVKLIKAEWFNHVMLPLSLVSNFVDVVSYLRLFAVGSAGVAVAQSFNTMAANAAEGGGAGYLLAAFIAIFGHTLNLLLAAMAVLVHGVRLNTLEFSAHLGLQWSGVPYRPFGRRTAAAASSRATTDTNGSEV